MRPGIFLLDNYDSFTWNLAQGLMELGADVTVKRHDEVSVPEVLSGEYRAIVISPGPGRPENAGITLPLVRAAAGRLPLLGVCLGHQAIALAYGARVARAPRVVHGKSSDVHHDGRGIFRGLATPLRAGRYHSLAVEAATLPPELVASAVAHDEGGDTVMGLRHREHAGIPVEGVQFHPESILTPDGMRLLGNFLSMACVETG
jgi:anthranilate synthase/aminodeoxychorismate synthase-like glutamine amidotransferase